MQALIAFSSTSVITLVVVALAYLGDVIPNLQEPEDKTQKGVAPGLVNDLDGYVIERFQYLFGLKGLKGRFNPDVDGFEALQRFMLALSDTQIVTGLAIFIIGFLKHCELSSYHFIVIMALGWFSFTTHLSTLSVLQGHLAKRRVEKAFRVLGIIATYVLLSISFVLLYSQRYNNVALQCRIAHMGLWAATKLRGICAILLLMFLSTMSLSKVARFCFGRDSEFSSLRRMVWKLFRKSKPKGPYRERYFRMKKKNVKESRGPAALKALQKALLSFNYVLLEYLDSFLWELTWLFFSNFYGIRQIWWAREFVGSQVMSVASRSQQNASTFGQILALLMLSIPVLAGWRAIQGKRPVTA